MATRIRDLLDPTGVASKLILVPVAAGEPDPCGADVRCARRCGRVAPESDVTGSGASPPERQFGGDESLARTSRVWGLRLLIVGLAGACLIMALTVATHVFSRDGVAQTLFMSRELLVLSVLPALILGAGVLLRGERSWAPLVGFGLYVFAAIVNAVSLLTGVR